MSKLEDFLNAPSAVNHLEYTLPSSKILREEKTAKTYLVGVLDLSRFAPFEINSFNPPPENGEEVR